MCSLVPPHKNFPFSKRTEEEWIYVQTKQKQTKLFASFFERDFIDSFLDYTENRGAIFQSRSRI